MTKRLSHLRPLALFFCLGLALVVSGCASGASANHTTGNTGSSNGGGATATTASSHKTLPTDPCSLLTDTALQQAVGEPFGPPQSQVANSGGATVVTAANCTYTSQSGSGTVTFIIFQDPSTSVAKNQFDNFKLSFPAAANGQISGLGDDAYIDTSDAVHVLKGDIRFYIAIDDSLLADSAAVDAADKQLATGVTAQI